MRFPKFQVPTEVREELEFVPVSKMDEVLANALTHPEKLVLDTSGKKPAKKKTTRKKKKKKKTSKAAPAAT